MSDDLVTRIRLGLATELACAGAYRRAEELVAGAPGTPLQAQELDLLARIYVRQDRFAEARACWKRAISAHPNEQTYLRALEVLDEYQERLHLRDRIIKSLYVFMALIGIFAVTLLLVFRKLG